MLTAYLSPDREPIFRAFPAATNHQGIVEWPEQARRRARSSASRRSCGCSTTRRSTSTAFVDASCGRRCSRRRTRTGSARSTRRCTGPGTGWSTIAGPTHTWRLGFDAFVEGEHTEVLAEPTFAAESEHAADGAMRTETFQRRHGRSPGAPTSPSAVARRSRARSAATASSTCSCRTPPRAWR